MGDLGLGNTGSNVNVWCFGFTGLLGIDHKKLHRSNKLHASIRPFNI